MFRTIVKASLATGASALILAFTAMSAQAQGQAEPTRADTIVADQQKKARELTLYEGSKAEQVLTRIENTFITGMKIHPFFESALAGGGFTLGAGYRRFVSPYNTIDVRGSITFSGYKRIEAEFLAPRIFKRRGVLSVIGGWREATQVGFYGFGTANTSVDDRANYSFDQPYLVISLDYRPTRKYLVLGATVDYSQWRQGSGSGTAPSVEEVYTPATLPGLGSSPNYVHFGGRAGFDWRTSPGYTRTGGYYGVEAHEYLDPDGEFGFRQADYTAIQHFPILRNAWVLSLRGQVVTTFLAGDQTIPFYMLPALGGGSSLRGFASWRFRDRHSLLLSSDFRVLANNFLDMAVFYDAGKVVARTGDLDLDGLKSDYGIGFRIHSPVATPLRIELAKSNEGLALVFSAKAAF
jgi:Omp85 superfamily domain